MFFYYKPILILLITFASFSVCKAQKCKLEKNEVDALTELSIKRTSQELLTRINNEPVYFKAQSIGTNRYLKLIYFTYGNFTFKEEREIKLTTTLNEEVTLFPRVAPKDTTKSDDLYNVRSIIIYKLSPEQYEILTSNAVIGFKYYVTTGWVEQQIKQSKQITLQQILKCVE